MSSSYELREEDFKFLEEYNKTHVCFLLKIKSFFLLDSKTNRIQPRISNLASGTLASLPFIRGLQTRRGHRPWKEFLKIMGVTALPPIIRVTIKPRNSKLLVSSDR